MSRQLRCATPALAARRARQQRMVLFSPHTSTECDYVSGSLVCNTAKYLGLASAHGITCLHGSHSGMSFIKKGNAFSYTPLLVICFLPDGT